MYLNSLKILKILNKNLSQHPNIAEIRGHGLLLGIEIVKDKDTVEPFSEEERVTNQIKQKGLQNGVFLYPGGTGQFRDIICLGPAFIINDDDINLMTQVAIESIKEVTEKLMN